MQPAAGILPFEVIAVHGAARWAMRKTSFSQGPRSQVVLSGMADFHPESLIRRIAGSRDRAAFSELFAFYAPRIKTFLMRRGVTAELAEDLAQEALLSVWRKAGQYEPQRASAAAWIFTIARNLKIDEARRKARAQKYAETEEPPPPPPELPEESLLTEEREFKVRSALGSLPVEQQRVVVLSFFEGRPHQEIAALLKLPLGTVKSRLRLAFGRLREILGDFHE